MIFSFSKAKKNPLLLDPILDWTIERHVLSLEMNRPQLYIFLQWTDVVEAGNTNKQIYIREEEDDEQVCEIFRDFFHVWLTANLSKYFGIFISSVTIELFNQETITESLLRSLVSKLWNFLSTTEENSFWNVGVLCTCMCTKLISGDESSFISISIIIFNTTFSSNPPYNYVSKEFQDSTFFAHDVHCNFFLKH